MNLRKLESVASKDRGVLVESIISTHERCNWKTRLRLPGVQNETKKIEINLFEGLHGASILY